MARPICLRLLVHWARRAASRADCTAGSSSAINTAMIAITTSNSMSVKPRRLPLRWTKRSMDGPPRVLEGDERGLIIERIRARTVPPGRATQGKAGTFGSIQPGMLLRLLLVLEEGAFLLRVRLGLGPATRKPRPDRLGAINLDRPGPLGGAPRQGRRDHEHGQPAGPAQH